MFLSFTKKISLGLALVLIVAWHAAQAATISYTLDNVLLDDGTGMTGTFSWTFDAGDFENGVGQFV